MLHYKKQGSQSQNSCTVYYKSYCQMLAIAINVTFGAFFIGYSLVFVGAIRFQHIITFYGFQNWDPDLTESIVNGLVPLMAIFGALISSVIIKNISRRQLDMTKHRKSFLLTNAIAAVSILLILIKNPFTIIAGRSIQGISVGIFSAIVPLYLNQILTPDTSNLGGLNHALVATAQGFCFLWYYILTKIFRQNQEIDLGIIWNILVLFPLLTLAIQTFVFVFVFPYETPKFLLSINKKIQADELLSKIYRREVINKVKQQLQDTYIDNQYLQDSQISQRINQQQKYLSSKLKTSNAAILFGVHLLIFQQMDGINAILIYGKETLQKIIGNNQQLIDLSQIFIASFPAFMCAVGVKLINIKGRKFLIQMGTLAIIFCLMTVIIAIIVSQNIQDQFIPSLLIISAMGVYMTFFGLTIGPIVWLYVAQIVQPQIISPLALVNFSAASVVILLFPLIKSKMIVSFSIFFVWCIGAYLINKKYMIETKNKSRQEIFQQYNSLKI